MKRLVTALLAALLCLPAVLFGAQNANSPAAGGAAAAKKRGPVFRATKEQIKQAQTLRGSLNPAYIEVRDVL